MNNNSSRIGKIARLPRVIRERLNVRMEDGEAAPVLLEWLNGLPVTKEIMEDCFEGRAVTEQNLSVWRQGGFVEWQRNQERRAVLLEFLTEGEELEEELQTREGGEALTDRLAEMVALELALLLRAAMKEECGEKRRKAVLEIARELGRLRRGDHRRAEVRMKQDRWQTEQEEKSAAEMEGMKRQLARVETGARVRAQELRAQYEQRQAAGTLDPKWAAKVREIFAKNGERLKGYGVPEWVPPVDQRPVEQRGEGAVGGTAMAAGGTNGTDGANGSGCAQPGAAQGESK